VCCVFVCVYSCDVGNSLALSPSCTFICMFVCVCELCVCVCVNIVIVIQMVMLEDGTVKEASSKDGKVCVL